MGLQARIWYQEGRFEEAKSEALRAVDIFEKLGAAADLKQCREFLKRIEDAINESATSGKDSDGELLETAPPPACSNLLLSAQSTIE